MNYFHFGNSSNRISRLQDFANVNIPTETGAVKTTSPSELRRRSLESTRIERDSMVFIIFGKD